MRDLQEEPELDFERPGLAHCLRELEKMVHCDLQEYPMEDLRLE